MRISTAQFYQQGVNAILDQQSQLSQTQLQLSTGKRIVTPADDPAGAAQALGLSQDLSLTQQYQSNADAANAQLGLEDTTLQSAVNLLQQAHDLAVQAGDASQTSTARAGIAQQAQQIADQLLSLANTRDANGQYIFAGYQGNSVPFTRAANGAVAYNGDQGQRFMQIGPAHQVAVGDSGAAVFQLIRNGNGTFVTGAAPSNTGTGIIDAGRLVDPSAYQAHDYTVQFTAPGTYNVIDNTTGGTVLSNQSYASGGAISFDGLTVTISGQPAAGDSFTVQPSTNQDLFTTLQNFVNAMQNPATTPAAQAQVTSAVNRSLAELNQGLQHVLAVDARVGARLNAVSDQKNVNGSVAVQTQQTLASVQDLNFASAVSTLNQQLLALQAAEKSFLKVQGLSLFQYL